MSKDKLTDSSKTQKMELTCDSELDTCPKNTMISAEPQIIKPQANIQTDDEQIKVFGNPSFMERKKIDHLFEPASKYTPVLKQPETTTSTTSFHKPIPDSNLHVIAYQFLADSTGTTNLHRATRNLDSFSHIVHNLKSLQNSYIRIQNNYGHTLLHFSVFFRTPAVTNMLLNELHAPPDQRDYYDRNLYHYVAEIKQESYLNYFISLDNIPRATSEKMLNVWDTKGHTPVNIAIANRNIKILNHFAKKGADFNQIEPKLLYTYLHQAADIGDSNIVRIVLSNMDRSNINLLGADDHTALHRAVINANKDMTKLLLDCGADPDVYVDDQSILGLIPLTDAGDEVVDIIKQHCPAEMFYDMQKYRFFEYPDSDENESDMEN